MDYEDIAGSQWGNALDVIDEALNDIDEIERDFTKTWKQEEEYLLTTSILLEDLRSKVVKTRRVSDKQARSIVTMRNGVKQCLQKGIRNTVVPADLICTETGSEISVKRKRGRPPRSTTGNLPSGLSMKLSKKLESSLKTTSTLTGEDKASS